MKLHDTVLAIIADLTVVKGKVALTDEKLQQWMSTLAKPEARRQTRLFLDCAEAAMRLQKQRQPGAAAQLLVLSAIGLNDGQRAARRREGGDAWSRMKPARFSVVC
jgi:hypothetical protein